MKLMKNRGVSRIFRLVGPACLVFVVFSGCGVIHARPSHPDKTEPAPPPLLPLKPMNLLPPESATPATGEEYLPPQSDSQTFGTAMAGRKIQGTRASAAVTKNRPVEMTSLSGPDKPLPAGRPPEWDATALVPAPDRGTITAPKKSEPGTAALSAPAASPGLRAGFAEDNAEFGAFLDFLERNRSRIPVPMNVGDRIVIRAADGSGRPASWAKIDITDSGGAILASRTAYADGRTLFFPSENPRFHARELTLEAAWNGERATVPFDPAGPRTVEVRFTNPPGAQGAVARPALDVCFLLDATGSMDDEIARLKDTIAAVYLQIANLVPKPDIRLGLVQYRDRRDAFVTRVTPFTGRMEEFADALRDVVAAGGGDAPEDLQEGLRVTLSEMKWRDDAIRIVFLLTDASPQLYPDQGFTYMDAARQAAERGIKIVGIGASGLPLAGEIALRQLGAYTMGQFVFLTYGETNESDGGTRTSVSHHTGANWRTRNLDAIIVRFVRSELAALKGETLREDDWLETDPSAGADRDAVLAELFDDGVRRLLDFSLMKLEPGTPTAVLPLPAKSKDMKTAAELLESRLLLAVARHPAFLLVERKDLRQVIEEQKLSLTGAVAEADAVKVGKIVGARLLIVPSLTPGKTRHELLLKLVRVETSEVLALSLLKIAPELTR